ncbi:hypothetical protein DFJ73DRAFT_826024 [Zopfochytrium polystomum]|nr:hypothetical protein DFJ73DRAFT_826024 [Zopfochytrium polystomum]
MQLQQRRPCRIPRQQPPQKQLVRLAALVVLAAALSASLVACPASAQRSSSSAASKSTSSAASAAAPPQTTSSSAPAAATTSSSDPAAAPAATTTTNNGNGSPATTAAAASASSPAVWTFVPMAIYLRSPDGSLTGDPAVTQPVVPSSSPYYGAVTGKSASGGLTGWKKGVVIAGSIIGGLALLMGGSYLYVSRFVSVPSVLAPDSLNLHSATSQTKHNDDKEKHQESTALSDFGATQPPRPSSDLPPKFDYAAGSGGDGLQKPEPAAGGGASAYSAPPPSKYAEDAAAYRPTSPPGSATAHSPHSAAPYGYPSTGAAAAAGGQATSVAAYGSYGATPPPTGYVPATNAYSAAYGAQQQQAYGYGAGYAAAGAYQQQYYASPPGPHPSSPYAAAQASPYAGSQASGYQQSGYRY